MVLHPPPRGSGSPYRFPWWESKLIQLRERIPLPWLEKFLRLEEKHSLCFYEDDGLDSFGKDRRKLADMGVQELSQRHARHSLLHLLGMGCTIVVGASKPESAARHPNIAIALKAGAMLDTTPRVAYNGVIQPYAARLAEKTGAWQLPYAISLPDNAPPEAVRAFLAVGGEQIKNLPDEVETIVIPFGSGNTAAGVLYGLAQAGLDPHVVLVGVGPDRIDWLGERLEAAKVTLGPVDHIPLHGWYADYGDRMAETQDDIVFHPTYEGKVIRFLNRSELPWWKARDGKTLFWIVGS